MIEALPSIEFIIKGDRWRCIGTATTDEGVIDTIKNLTNNEIREVERNKLVTYLQKNKSKENIIKKESIYLYSSNNQTKINL